MGEMADYALDNAMDDFDTFDRWERDGSCPQEGYDLGILNEHGGMEEFPFAPTARQASNTRCKYCGSTDVYWSNRGGKWILFNYINQVSHSCKEYYLKKETK